MKNQSAVSWRQFVIAAALLILGVFGAGVTKSQAKGTIKPSPKIAATSTQKSGTGTGTASMACGGDVGNCAGSEWFPVGETIAECCCPTTYQFYHCIVESDVYTDGNNNFCYRLISTVYETDPCIASTTPGGNQVARCCSQ